MRITKLEMKNFGPYKGIFELNLQNERNKNIDIITGKNGTGKTHIFNAVQWCLYGYQPSPRDQRPRKPTRGDAWFHLYGTNKIDETPPEPYMYVTLWLEEDTTGELNRYIIQRVVKPREGTPAGIYESSQIDVVLTVKENGKEISNPTEKIDSLLPVSASQFFMFHGEDLRPMSQRHMDHTKNAIELILEAELFRQGLRDLKDVSKNIQKELNDELRKVEGLKSIVNSKEEKLKLLEEKENEIEETKNNLQDNKNLLKDVEFELSAFESTKSIMENIEYNKRMYKQVEEDIKKLLIRRDSLINQLPSLVILPNLIDVLETKEIAYNNNNEIKESMIEINGKYDLLNQISKLSKCFCGNNIGDIELTFINTQKNKYKEELMNLELKLVIEDPSYYAIRDMVIKLKNNELDFETYEKDLNNLYLRRDELESAINKAEKLLSGINKEEIMKLTIKRNNIYTTIGELEERIKNLNKEKEDINKIIDRFNRLINQKERSFSISTSIDLQYDLSNKIKNSFEYILEELTQLRKEQLMAYTTKCFVKLTNNPEEYVKIEIDDSYNVNVIDSTGSIRKRENLSTGERGVIALSFILGLKAASEKNAPLILDTFFSHLDESHYTNIARELPTFANQIILILTDLEYKSLKERVSEDFFEYVNNIYVTKRIHEAERSEIIKWEGIL